jgi:ParB-like chromosome segregation protein Spo0J
MAKTIPTPAVWVHVNDLNPWDRNPRDNDEAALAVAEAIHEFGFTSPIVAQKGTSRIINGHTRQKAVLTLLAKDPTWAAPDAPGPGMVPVRFVDVSDDDATRIAIADNRLGDIATWNEDDLSKLLGEFDLDDLSSLGFDAGELSVLLGSWEDPFPELPDPDPDGGDTPDPLDDQGTAKITIELPITSAQDAAQVIREALTGLGLKGSAYKLAIK